MLSEYMNMYYSVISLANVLFSSPYIVFDHLNVLRFVIQGSVIITNTNVIFLSMQGDSNVTIVRQRYGDRCSESITGSAGYSYLSADCIKGCAASLELIAPSATTATGLPIVSPRSYAPVGTPVTRGASAVVTMQG